jgi:hypothetical protein
MPQAGESSTAEAASEPTPSAPAPDSVAPSAGVPKTPAPPPIKPPARPEPAPVAEFLDLFPEQVAPPEYILPVRPDPAVLAAALEARFAGTTVAWRGILRTYAATDVTPAELKAALAVLRRGGRAAYKALKKDDDAIDFLANPVVRDKPKRRSKAADDGGLFGGGGEEPDPGAGE